MYQIMEQNSNASVSKAHISDTTFLTQMKSNVQFVSNQHRLLHQV
jgi:hypothetical protein